ncbi:MAG: hypothetical protein C0592_11630 [Marinilabiliales bacterium]|mgnify:CR=1 FL=1|nr:MAG: hypothetical protein C0592_11630 [Marinilabiliales bacterium]
MDLTTILTVAGKPGLFKVHSQTKSGLIAESLIDGKKVPVFANDRVSSLSDISIFTTGDDMPLADVFAVLFKKLNGEKAIDPKSDKYELFAFMDEHLPEWDEDRVYPSDLKKLFTWYNILIEHKLIDLEIEEEEKADEAEGEEESKKDENES